MWQSGIALSYAGALYLCVMALLEMPESSWSLSKDHGLNRA